MKVFISYARVDKRAVAPLAEYLDSAGYQTWFDHMMLSGQDWKEVLQMQISSCQVFLPIISQDSKDSEWCKWELAKAVESQKSILPVLLNEQTPVHDLLAALHHAVLTNHASIAGGLSGISPKQIAYQSSFEYPANPIGEPSRAKYLGPQAVSAHFHLVDDEAMTNERSSRKMLVRTKLGGLKDSNSVIVGIDFGTANSVCSYCDTRGIGIVPDQYGYESFPSAVYVEANGEFLTGRHAKAAIHRDPANGVLQIKRLFGTRINLLAHGKKYSAPILASEVLKSLKKNSEAYLNRECNYAVITVPAHFGEKELDDVYEACGIAKLTPTRILTELSAAAFAFQLDQESKEKLTVVFDLGCGTFDVSILELNHDVVENDDRLDGEFFDVYEVLAVDGSDQLGGADYDEALISYCLSEFLSQTSINLEKDSIARARIREAAEEAKIQLSTKKSSIIFVHNIHANASGAIDLRVPISLNQFNEITSHLTAHIFDCCDRALRMAKVKKDSLNNLLLVGLASRTPSIMARVEDFFGLKARIEVNPVSAVAIGAASQAAVVLGNDKNKLFLDTYSREIGILLEDEFLPVVKKNQKIPTEKWLVLKTKIDQQKGARIQIAERDFYAGEKWRVLSKFCFYQITQAASGDSKLAIRFDVGIDRQLNVTIFDCTSLLSRTLDVSDRPLYEVENFSSIDGEMAEITSQIEYDLTWKEFKKRFKEQTNIKLF